MKTWDDLAVELNRAREAFERAVKTFKSLTKTYQDLIDYCKKISEGEYE